MDEVRSSVEKVEKVLNSLKAGEIVVLSDDESREDEGDLVFLASKAKKEHISFMLNHGRGLICVSLSEEKRQALGIPIQVAKNEAVFGTNFGVPFSLNGIDDSGMSSSSKVEILRKIAGTDMSESDVVFPGFLVPVVAREGGVLQRRGQTEGSVDLAKFALGEEVAVICEILDERGEVVRGSSLDEFCKINALARCSVEDIVRYRRYKDTSVRQIVEKEIYKGDILKTIRESVGFDLDAKHSSISPDLSCKIIVFMDDVDQVEHFALLFGELKNDLKVRVHSECLTGDIFGSLKCDCGEQLDKSIQMLLEDGSGLLVYLRQEGRGIGLLNKLKAYEYQEKGYDTVEANQVLGFDVDLRDYKIAASILIKMGLSSIKLVTNNPKKFSEIGKLITISERLSLEVKSSEENYLYLKTKKEKLGHFLKDI